MDDAEKIVHAQRERGRKAGREWAASLPEPVGHAAIIDEADRRWPYNSADYIAAYNLSGGFIDGARSYFKGETR